MWKSLLPIRLGFEARKGHRKNENISLRKVQFVGLYRTKTVLSEEGSPGFVVGI